MHAHVHVGVSSDLIRQADAVVRANAPQLNAAQRQMALAIGILETGFGVSGDWLFDDGTPSYNWGGLVGSGTAGSLQHGDIDPTGKGTHYGFQAFNNMDEAFRSFLRTWSKPGNQEAAITGDALATARSMCTNGYFGGTKGTAEDRAQLYAHGILNSAKTVASQLGEPFAVNWDSTGSAPLVGDRCNSTVTRAGSKKTPLILATVLAAGFGFAVYWLAKR